MKCEWFALCDNDTDKTLDHPVLGPVPCCERCVRQVGGDVSELVAALPNTDGPDDAP